MLSAALGVKGMNTDLANEANGWCGSGSMLMTFSGGCPVPLASGICGEFIWGQGGALCGPSMDVSLKSPRF